jgi:hypothetical protein
MITAMHNMKSLSNLDHGGTMKAKTLSQVAMLATLVMLNTTARASTPEPMEWKTNPNGCHVLLTVQECAAHRDALASIASIAQRYAYLEQRGIPLREREVLCSNNRVSSAIIYYPMRGLRVANR